LNPHRSLCITCRIILIRLLTPISFRLSLRISTSISTTGLLSKLISTSDRMPIFKHLSNHTLMMLLSDKKHICVGFYIKSFIKILCIFDENLIWRFWGKNIAFFYFFSFSSLNKIINTNIFCCSDWFRLWYDWALFNN